MGPVIGLLAFAGVAAAAAPVMLVAPDGDPRVGSTVRLWAIVHRQGAAALDREPRVTPAEGEVVRWEGELSPGIWSFLYEAPTAPGQVAFHLSAGGDVATARLDIRPWPEPSLALAASVIALAGQTEPVEIEVTGASLPDSDDLQVSVPEGRVVGVSRVGDRLVVRWFPGADPFPRALAVGVRDGRLPESPPAWTVVRLRARARIPLQTEPGSSATLTVRGRVYGPFVAGVDGVAQAAIEVRPGEDLAEVEVRDRVGNTQTSTLSLGGVARPSLGALAAGPLTPGRPSPPVHLFAVDPRGGAWKGEPPSCETSRGDQVTPVLTAPGTWWVPVPAPPDAVFFDLRVDCSIGDLARASARLPVEDALPARLVLRAWPEVLTADLPVAQVQAFLENRLGDRLPAEGIEIRAEQGEIRLDGDGGLAVVSGRYSGEAAAASGGDRLDATWSLPPGEGGAWDLTVSTRPDPGGGLWVSGRALDQVGRPLQGVPLRVEIEGQRVATVTGADGWGEATLPAPDDLPAVVEVRSGEIVRRVVLFEGTSAGADPSAPDLHATLDLPIRAGRVHEVFLATEPRVLSSGPGQTARVVVRLVDRSGNAVSDEEIALEASTGALTEPVRRPDGAFEATYTPPDGLPYGSVRITASGIQSAIAASTDLEVAPRRLRRAPGLNVGYLVGTRGLASPWVDASLDLRLTEDGLPLFAHVSVGGYGEQVTVEDEATGSPLDMRVTMLPVSVGGLTRFERARQAAWLGGAVVLAPYWLDASFDGASVASGLGLSPPGVSLIAGGGLRVKRGEVQVQASYLFLGANADGIGWTGPFGGLVGTFGYKLLY